MCIGILDANKIMNEIKINEKQIYQWIAKASAPVERIKSGAFKQTEKQNEVIVNDREKCWNDILNANGMDKKTILKNRGISETELKESVMDVEVVKPEKLPVWAKQFKKLIELWAEIQNTKPNEMENNANKNDESFTIVWAYLASLELENTIENMKEKNIIVSDKAIGGLTDYLNARLFTPLINIMNPYPYNQPDKNGLGKETYMSFSFWKEMLDKQPVIAAVIGETYDNWIHTTDEMLQRFVDDKEIIKEKIFKKTDGKKIRIKNIKCGLGDPHRGGRSVAIVSTNYGEVVYKPKNLLGTQCIGEMLRQLYEIDKQIVPLTPKFINKGKYGWEQKIEHKKCNTKKQIKMFYTRLGAWLRILQILNANDFWYDNLIANADMPYFIDYETIVGGSTVGNIRRNTLAYIGILPMKSPSFNKLKDPIDISCMVKPGKQLTPLNNADINISIIAKHFAPYLKNKYADINEYFNEFENGFRKINKILNQNIGQKIIKQFIRNIKNARFRHILIDTWSAYALINSITKSYKRDGVRRQIAHDKMFQWMKQNGQENVDIVEATINDIWKNDIPMFELQANSKHIYTIDNKIIKNAFQCTAVDDVENNMRNMKNIENDIAEMHSLYSLRDNARRKYKIKKNKNEYNPLDVARNIANEIENNLTQYDDFENCLHMGINHFPLGDRQLESLSVGFDGAAGIAMLLARLNEIKENEKYIKLIRRLYKFMEAKINLDKNEFYYCGSSSDNIAVMVGLNEIKHIVDVRKMIEKLCGAIDEYLTESLYMFDDYSVGVSGLMSALVMTHKNGLIGENQYGEMMEKINEKKLIETHFNPLLEALLTDFSPNAYWGGKLVGLNIQKYKGGNNTFANFNAEIITQKNNGKKMLEKIKKLMGKNIAKQNSEIILSALYSFLYLKRYCKNSANEADKEIKLLCGILYNRYQATGRWFPDNWANPKHLIAARMGNVDVAMAFLNQTKENEINQSINPARIIENL